jgi:hypothetical protein
MVIVFIMFLFYSFPRHFACQSQSFVTCTMALVHEARLITSLIDHPRPRAVDPLNILMTHGIEHRTYSVGSGTSFKDINFERSTFPLLLFTTFSWNPHQSPSVRIDASDGNVPIAAATTDLQVVAVPNTLSLLSSSHIILSRSTSSADHPLSAIRG